MPPETDRHSGESSSSSSRPHQQEQQQVEETEEAASSSLSEALLPPAVSPNDDTNREQQEQEEAVNNNEDPWKNRNVLLSFVLCIFSGIADSIWGAVVLTGFLYALARHTHFHVPHFALLNPSSTTGGDDANTLVGFAEAVQGLTQLVSALPVGIWADLTGKARVVAVGGALMLITIGLTLMAIYSAMQAEKYDSNDDDDDDGVIFSLPSYSGTMTTSSRCLWLNDGNYHQQLGWLWNDLDLHELQAVHDDDDVFPYPPDDDFTDPSSDDADAAAGVAAANRAYWIMLIALGFWGIVSGISYGPSQALFSDSIRKGKRSQLLTVLYSCYLLSSTVGPLVSIVLLTEWSGRNTASWSLAEMSPVFVVGIVLEIPAAVLMFFFSERYVVREDDDNNNNNNNNNNQNSNHESPEAADAASEQQQQQSSSASLQRQQSAEEIAAAARYKAWGKASIPYVLFTSSLFFSLGSGASVKYFPLFFKELGFESAQVQGIFLFVPVSISMFSFVGQRLSRFLGRVETCLLCYGIGVSLLYYMTYLSRDEDHLTNWGKYWIVIVYLLRTGIMNCPYPLLESILMDAVPSNRRARWKSLESIAAFGWTGSALAGGIIADEASYSTTFRFTATLQLIGSAVLIFIQPFVEAEHDEDSDENGGSSAVVATASAAAAVHSANTNHYENESELEEPLLAQQQAEGNHTTAHAASGSH